MKAGITKDIVAGALGRRLDLAFCNSAWFLAEPAPSVSRVDIIEFCFQKTLRNDQGADSCTSVTVACRDDLISRQLQRIGFPGSASDRRTWLSSVLTRAEVCSYFVLMSIETLGEAYRLSWRVRVRCVRGYIESPAKVQPCGHQAVLDLATLVWAKGRNFPLGRLGSRLMCPVCGNRDVNVIFEPPPMVRTVVAGR